MDGARGVLTRSRVVVRTQRSRCCPDTPCLHLKGSRTLANLSNRLLLSRSASCLCVVQMASDDETETGSVTSSRASDVGSPLLRTPITPRLPTPSAPLKQSTPKTGFIAPPLAEKQVLYCLLAFYSFVRKWRRGDGQFSTLRRHAVLFAHFLLVSDT